MQSFLSTFASDESSLRSHLALSAHSERLTDRPSSPTFVFVALALSLLKLSFAFLFFSHYCLHLSADVWRPFSLRAPAETSIAAY